MPKEGRSKDARGAARQGVHPAGTSKLLLMLPLLLLLVLLLLLHNVGMPSKERASECQSTGGGSLAAQPARWCACPAAAAPVPPPPALEPKPPPSASRACLPGCSAGLLAASTQGAWHGALLACCLTAGWG